MCILLQAWPNLQKPFWLNVRRLSVLGSGWGRRSGDWVSLEARGTSRGWLKLTVLSLSDIFLKWFSLEYRSDLFLHSPVLRAKNGNYDTQYQTLCQVQVPAAGLLTQLKPQVLILDGQVLFRVGFRGGPGGAGETDHLRHPPEPR